MAFQSRQSFLNTGAVSTFQYDVEKIRHAGFWAFFEKIDSTFFFMPTLVNVPRSVLVMALQ